MGGKALVHIPSWCLGCLLYQNRPGAAIARKDMYPASPSGTLGGFAARPGGAGGGLGARLLCLLFQELLLVQQGPRQRRVVAGPLPQVALLTLGLESLASPMVAHLYGHGHSTSRCMMDLAPFRAVEACSV